MGKNLRLRHHVKTISEFPKIRRPEPETHILCARSSIFMYILTVIEHGSSDPGPTDYKFSRPAPCRGMSRAPGGRDLPTPDPGRRTA
jgi:hypothetical protein